MYHLAAMVALLVISFSVAADATAVAIAAAVRGASMRYGAALALAFGVAQAAMAAIGWLGGATLGTLWTAWDHWVALALLGAVGAKMIKEAFQSEKEEEEEEAAAEPGFASLVVLSIATSIDALAVGVSLPTLGTPALLSLAMIGVVTFLCSAAGAAFGRYLGQRFGKVMEVAGGLALIAIGIRIVVEHT